MTYLVRVSKLIESGFIRMILPAESRINRSRYLANNGIILLIIMLIYLALDILPNVPRVVGYLAMVFPILWLMLLNIKRLHDINCSGWCLIVNFIPDVNIIFSLILALAPGTEGINKFGDQPGKSSRLVYLMAFMSIVLSIVIGLVAAIFESKA